MDFFKFKDLCDEYQVDADDILDWLRENKPPDYTASAEEEFRNAFEEYKEVKKPLPQKDLSDTLPSTQPQLYSDLDSQTLISIKSLKLRRED